MRKLQKWDLKQCASQICHSKHQHRKNETPNMSHLIILPFLYIFFKYLARWNVPSTLPHLCMDLETCRSFHRQSVATAIAGAGIAAAPCLAGWLVGPLAGCQYGRRRPGQAGRLLQLPWACSRPPGWPPPPLAGRQAVVAAAGVQEAWPPLLGSNETILHICYFYVKNILDSKMCKKNPRHNNKHNNHDFISKFHEFKVNKFISHNHNFNLEEFHLIWNKI